MLENNSSRLMFAAIAVVVGGVIYGTVNAAYPEATNQIIKKIQSTFDDSNTPNANSISVVDNKPANMTINIAYAKLPNGQYISGSFPGNGLAVNNNYYSLPTNSDFSDFYDKYSGGYFDDNSNIKLSNGLSFTANGMAQAYNYSSTLGKDMFESQLNMSPENVIADQLMLNPKTNNVEKSTDNTNQTIDLESQSLSTVDGQPYTYNSQPQDFDVSLQKTYVLDISSEDNVNLAKKLYPQFDFDSNQLYFLNKGSNLHIHYYEVEPNISSN